MTAAQSAPIRTMVARVSLDDIIIYANEALADYLSAPKRNLVGSSLEDVAVLCKGEVSSCFARPETDAQATGCVRTGSAGSLRRSCIPKVECFDIVLDEVAPPDPLGGDVERVQRDASRIAERGRTSHIAPPRAEISHCYLHAASRTDAIRRSLCANGGEIGWWIPLWKRRVTRCVQTGCTVGETSRDAVLGIYGAPRYYADHPLRAILAACDQIQKDVATPRRSLSRRKRSASVLVRDLDGRHPGGNAWELRFGSATPLSARQLILRRGFASWHVPGRRCFPSTH